MQAGGRTAGELEHDIAAKLSATYLQSPQVSVFVKEYNSQRITVDGAVAKPGIFPINGQVSLMQAIARVNRVFKEKAGGLVVDYIGIGHELRSAMKQYTEADLIKAPERDYMNEAQLAFFKQRLIEIRAQLLNNADDTGQHLRENEVTTDPSDRATLEEEYTLELRTRDRERKLLKKVEKSIKLIDDGEYGFCEETGEPIGIPRLLARPTATLSLEAQERRERMQKMYGE